VGLKFSVSNEVLEQIELLKAQLAHKHPDISVGVLFKKLCELGINEWNPSNSPTASQVKKQKTNDQENSNQGASPMGITFMNDQQSVYTASK
jgi:hypothetical protein